MYSPNARPPDKPSAHPAWIEVDLDALASNARVLRRALPAGTRLGVLVKANGYGHGLEMAAAAGLAGGADQLIVATLDEGLDLRRSGITAPILVVYPIDPAAVGDAVDAGLELTVSSQGMVRRLIQAWDRVSDRMPASRLRVQVEVDSGMGRGGIGTDGLVDLVAMLDATEGTEIVGVWSHLADGRDAAASGRQVDRFETATRLLADTGRSIPPRHMLATEGLVAATGPVYEMVRIGLGFYGELGLGYEAASERAALAADLRPALTLKARPIRLETVPEGATVGYGSEWRAGRTSLVGTLALGYADGWARSSWPGASALVRGMRVPLIGRVSMDSVCVDLTDVDDAGFEDVIVLLGAQGHDRIRANEVATIRETIPNEVLSTLGPRLPRRYLGKLAAG